MLFDNLLYYLTTGEITLFLKMQVMDDNLLKVLDMCEKKIKSNGLLSQNEAKYFLIDINDLIDF